MFKIRVRRRNVREQGNRKQQTSPPVAQFAATVYDDYDVTEQYVMPTQRLRRTSTFAAARGDKSAGNPQNRKYINYCTVCRQRRTEPRP